MVLDLDFFFFFFTVQHADDAAGPRQDPKESFTPVSRGAAVHY